MIGCVVAGGDGRRMGAPKATAELAGRPLISYPLAALAEVCERLVIVCKRGTELPAADAMRARDAGGGVDPPLAFERWDEADDPHHPIAGITHALERAGEPILVCGADLPFVTADACALVAAELRPGMKAAVAFCEGRLQPLFAAYAPEALEVLATAPAGEPLTRSVESLMPVPVDLPADLVFNVNTPEDLAEAERRLRS